MNNTTFNGDWPDGQYYMTDFYDANGFSGGFHCPCPSPQDTGETLFGRPIIRTFWRANCPVHADFPTFMRIRHRSERENNEA